MYMCHRFNTLFIFTFIMLLSVTGGAIAKSMTTFYVSPTGSDKNPGSLKKPFKTIEKARDAVRKMNVNMDGDIIVCLRGGRYILNESVIFDHRDSGHNGYKIIYQAYKGENPVISGGKAIKNWEKTENGLYKAKTNLNFRQLYVNGKRAIRARTPNKGHYHRLKFWNERDREIVIDKDLIQKWNNFRDIEIIPHLHWAEAILPLASFETFGTYAYIVVQEPERDIVFRRIAPFKSENEAFHFENALEFLDQPGEWYHDKSDNTLYYKPRPGEDMKTTGVIAPDLVTLIKLTGTLDQPVHHMVFKGIQFSHSGWILPRDTGMLDCQAGFYSIKVEPDNVQYFARPPAAFYVAAAHHLRFERNIFTHLGSTALDLHYGTHDDVITGNVFYDISGGGIIHTIFSENRVRHTHVYAPEDKREICTNDTISNNLITQIAQDYLGCCGIACGFPRAVVIEHNEIYDLPYTGISVGWSWLPEGDVMKDNQIRYNHIYDVIKILCDGGGIYTLSKQPNSFIKENYIHDIYRSEWAVGSKNNGIFLDQGSHEIIVEHNVFQNLQEEPVRHHDTSTIISIKNDTQDQSVIDNSGLQDAYKDIRSRLPQDH